MLTKGKHPFKSSISVTGETSYEPVSSDFTMADKYDGQIAKDLVQWMIKQDHIKRPTVENVRDDDYFENATTKLQCLLEIYKFLETKSMNANSLEKLLNNQSKKIFGENWFDKLDDVLKSYLSNLNTSKYDGKKTKELMRCIRNMVSTQFIKLFEKSKSNFHDHNF